MLVVITYHYVRPSFEAPYPSIHGVTPAEFEQQLLLLAGLGKYVSLRDVLDAKAGASPLPDRALLVTLDDGLREQWDWALPILRRLGIPAAFFVNTGPILDKTVSSVHKVHLLRAQTDPQELLGILEERGGGLGVRVKDYVVANEEVATSRYRYDSPDAARVKFLLNHALAAPVRKVLIDQCYEAVFGASEASDSEQLYMSTAQLGELGARGYLGSHGHEHAVLGDLTVEEGRANIERSLNQLEAWTAERPFAMSYPYGSYEAVSPVAVEAARTAGIQLAFTMERAANHDLERPLHLARFDCNDLPGGKRPCFDEESLFEEANAASWYR